VVQGHHTNGRIGSQRGGQLARRREIHDVVATHCGGDHVAVGRERSTLDQHSWPARPQHAQRTDHLEQVDRDGVGHHDIGGRGTEHRSDLGANAERQVEPTSAPRTDESDTPLLLDGLGNTRGSGVGAWPEAVAGEIDTGRR
jgi:hypothetical protein